MCRKKEMMIFRDLVGFDFFFLVSRRMVGLFWKAQGVLMVSKVL